MKSRLARLMASCAVALLGLAIATPSAGQVSTGRIDATVADSTGAVLPGVMVDIKGPQAQSAVTDTLGEAHFLNLAPGTYTVTAKLSGFSDYLNKSIAVNTGSSVPLKIALGVAGVATQVQVTSDAPIVDTKKMGTSTNVSVEELQNIPSSRDPWVVLQTVPGVIVDRVNVGGAESGQQSSYQAKGASGAENTWNMDGIAITDMAATGSTPTYYDFDMFQDMQVTTGGADVTSPTPGVQLNMVLKSGSNTPHGSTRIYFENQDLQSKNLSSALAASIGGTSGKGNRMDQYYDTGFELGGPVLKNRVWAWGAYGKTHVDIITIGGTHDRTELKDSSFKGTGQLTSGVRANYTFFRGDKQKFGRGAGPTRADEATYNQSGPTTLQKGEANFVVGSNLFLAARASHVKGGFSLAARGGPTTPVYVDDGGVMRGSTDTYSTNRPQNSASLDGNSFRGKHELKFGFGWRKATVDSSDVYPGNGIVTYHVGYPEMQAKITRQGRSLTDTVYTSAYGGDTWSLNRLTLNLGVRWDRQAASLGAASVPGSTVLPSLLPALTATPAKNAVVWNAVTPRLGMTYALTEDRKTLARASYSMFASQLGATAAGTISAIQYSAIYYYAIDTNGNKIADPSEILFGLGNAGYYGFDPLNPTRLTTINQIGKYATPKTHEAMFGMDHELMPNFGISSTVTYRYNNHVNWNPRIGVTSADYRQTGTLTGTADPIGSFSAPFYAINPSAIPPGGGRSYEERKGYHQRFVGLEASAVKRMSNRWMARFGFSTNDHREYFDGAGALEDPTPTAGSPNKDGGTVVTQTGGSGKSNIFMVLPKYQFVANGLFQAPFGFNLGANWVLRQGYAIPYFRSNVPTGDALRNAKSVLVVDDVTRFRLPRVSSLDARVEKAFKIRRLNMMLDLDLFNITNAATVLGKQYDLRLTGATGYNQVLEIMNPRILRLGARLNF
ncbi:MAG: carboxypeptidase regulatory-like domain-containing protein [Vicinamibacterales bacterium]